MDFLYHSIIGMGLLAASPYLMFRAATDPDFRQDLRERLAGADGAPELKNCVWVHASSVGEVRAAKILLAKLAKDLPDLPTALSAFTPTGFEEAKKFPDVAAFRLPPDFPYWTHPLVDKLQPRALVLIEAELWPGLLRYCRKRGIPVVLVNGRITERSHRRYSRCKFLFRWLSEGIVLFSARTQNDAKRFADLGVPESKIRVTGNLKFDATAGGDGASSLAHKAYAPPTLAFGSTRPGDEEIILDAIQRLREEFPEWRYILAPRHVWRCAEVEQMIRERGLNFSLSSRLNKSAGKTASLILVDAMGELESWYAQSDVAFVGGGFRPEHGGQNILEPAVYGQPVIFGQHMQNFEEEALALREAGGGLQLDSPEDLYPTLQRLLSDPEERSVRGSRAEAAVKIRRGAAERNLELIQNILRTGAA